MIDIDKLARESGGSFDRSTWKKACLMWWTFSPDELQLFAEKVMLAAQKAERRRERGKVLTEGWDDRYATTIDALAKERERAKELVDILKDAKDYIPLAPIECNGNKCRELWCASCFDDETVSEAIVRSASTLKKASAAIAKYEGEK